jgi:DNA-cytosine methyltransferase
LKKGIVVLSLFDGMSCGRIALDRAGIKVDKYYASEIDKYAQIVSEKNYPDIIRLGNITKWQEWNIEKPDIIIGGSPCQGFSFAGKQLNFEDERSKLFFTFVDILKYYKPKYFLLENVKMKKEYQAVISNLLGAEPIEINSAFVSAQNRKRLYWTNIPNVIQPKDKGIFLKDIIENTQERGITKKCVDYIINKKGVPAKTLLRKSKCLTGGAHSGGTHSDMDLILVGRAENIKGHDYNKRIYSDEGKAPTLCGASGGNLEPKILTRFTKDGFHNYRNDTKKSSIQGTHVTFLTGKTHCLDRHIPKTEWRKLTPTECERLQTVPDNYTSHVSNSQRYKMLSNGWTVDIIAHILKGLK